LDSSGNLTDSGNKPSDYYTQSQLYTQSEIDNLQDNKTDKIDGGVEDNFVSIDSTGNIKDSGKSSDDYVINSLDDVNDGATYKRVASAQVSDEIDFTSNQIRIVFGDAMYGLGDNLKSWNHNSSSINNIGRTGFYYVSVTTSDSDCPFDDEDFILRHFNSSSIRLQIAYARPLTAGLTKMRTYDGGGWHEWNQLATLYDTTDSFSLETPSGKLYLKENQIWKTVSAYWTSSGFIGDIDDTGEASWGKVSDYIGRVDFSTINLSVYEIGVEVKHGSYRNVLGESTANNIRWMTSTPTTIMGLSAVYSYIVKMSTNSLQIEFLKNVDGSADADYIKWLENDSSCYDNYIYIYLRFRG
jgi:hypothetical protein